MCSLCQASMPHSPALHKFVYPARRVGFEHGVGYEDRAANAGHDAHCLLRIHDFLGKVGLACCPEIFVKGLGDGLHIPLCDKCPCYVRTAHAFAAGLVQDILHVKVYAERCQLFQNSLVALATLRAHGCKGVFQRLAVLRDPQAHNMHFALVRACGHFHATHKLYATHPLGSLFPFGKAA